MNPRINLIPEPIRVDRARGRRIRKWSVIVCVALAGSAVPTVASWMQTRKAEQLRAGYDQLQSDLNSSREELKSISAQANELFLRLERAKSLRSKRNWSGVFALIARTLPQGCWVTTLATDPDVPPPQQAAVKQAPVASAKPTDAPPEKPAPVFIEAPRRLRIVGQSIEASGPLAFVLQLKDAEVFRDVVLERSQRESDDTRTSFHFEVICTW